MNDPGRLTLNRRTAGRVQRGGLDRAFATVETGVGLGWSGGSRHSPGETLEACLRVSSHHDVARTGRCRRVGRYGTICCKPVVPAVGLAHFRFAGRVVPGRRWHGARSLDP